MAVGRRQVEGGVVPHVGGVDPRSPGDQHLHDLHVAALGGPVQGRELVVVTGKYLTFNSELIISLDIT